MNTRTGETWKMQHSTRQWVLYSDALRDTPSVVIQDQNAKAKEFEQKYGIDRQPPLLSQEELERKYGVSTAPAKKP